MPEWALSLMQLFGPMGFIMYITWRFQHHTIPRLVAENHAAMHQARNDFREILANQREDFKATIEREQAVHEPQTDMIIQRLNTIVR